MKPQKLQKPARRKSIYIDSRHHEILINRKRETRISLEALIDEALESGLKQKRWIPREAES